MLKQLKERLDINRKISGIELNLMTLNINDKNLTNGSRSELDKKERH